MKTRVYELLFFPWLFVFVLNKEFIHEVFLTRSQVSTITGLAKSSIYVYMGHGKFPRSVNLGRRRVAWLKSDIIEWMNSKKRRNDNEDLN